MSTALTDADLTLTTAANSKMAELFTQIEDNIVGVRLYATGGGCSGVSFGMAFTDVIDEDDGVRDFATFKVIVDDSTLEYLRGVEIDFVDNDDGNATFIFNNLPMINSGGCNCSSSSSDGGCGTSSSGAGGGCGSNSAGGGCA
ncbi:HesB/IscA family protein [Thiospirillum jenense]|uniref:Iron-sulfur cluster assembly accessory protein n=1 Tax=Thiospirillum jenense TaxID=1653858 RepID=A0A839HFQ2_9GAMM|nr:iron-sulfur cluster assembly accessory protein [Thiospirillum jenense]MBB1127244.1 iron-sulfur cluster assembly accessory protein [Thiospirillum jenense]